MWKKSLHSLKEFSQQPRKLWVPIVGGLAMMSFGVGILVSTTVKPGSEQNANFAGLLPFGKSASNPNTDRIGSPSPIVTSVVTQSPKERAELLKKTAQTSDVSLDRSRARYLLASDLLSSGKPQDALEQLKDLEKDYPVLSGPILLKRAQSQMAANKMPEALKTAQQLIQQYPKDPSAAEALALLGQQDKKYQEQLLAQFPSHPKTS